MLSIARMGLNDEDVMILVRNVRQARENGAGPDEAWSEAKAKLTGVHPEAIEVWRETVEERVSTEPAPMVAGQGNIVARNAVLESEVARLKKKVADLGAKNESLDQQLSSALEMIKPTPTPPEPEKVEPAAPEK